MAAAHVLNPTPEPPGKKASVLLAIAMHVLLAVFLIYGIRWQREAPEAVSVELVSAPPAPVAEAKPTPPPPPEPVQKVEPKPEPKPAPPPPKSEIAVKEKEKPKPPPKEVPPPKADPVVEQLKKREAEQLKREAEQLQRQAELNKLKADEASAARSRDMADYLGKIRGKIRGKIVRPPDVRGNPEAVFDVTQLPSGDILDVKLKKSSGSAALDAAIERAILSSSPLPTPKPELFNRSLELKFRPLED
jgi:colicin import membrane protein